MCGIIGIVSPISVSPDFIAEPRDTMIHRGPDDHGDWSSPDRRVSLGHRRLAILDLSAGGRQPMADPTGQLRVSFNGEIYNFRELRRELESKGYCFRSQSDTEVLLAAYRAWGTDCLARLSGMFAFGIYDARAGRLFLARDRAGEKPLFYCRWGRRFVFASELKALMAARGFPRRVDWQALEQYLAYGYVPGDQCLLDGVRKLPPAHALTYELESQRLRRWRYWNVPPYRPSPASDEELLGQLDHLLEDAVRRQLVADVPVGILLSGGVDSSLVTAMAARVSSAPVKTFTITFPGHAGYDESAFARAVARHFGTEHTELAAQPASADLLPELARQFDEPIADSSLVPTYLVSRLIRQHATVALGGDGGDELFAGYAHYRAAERQRVARHVPPALRRRAEAVIERLPLGMPGRNRLLWALSDPLGRVARQGSFFDGRARRALLRPATERGINISQTAEQQRAALCPDAASLLRRATQTDFLSYLPDDILVKVDRASMLNSLELRAPWLDHRLIEFAFGSVPDRLKATAGETKILPKRLARRLLPAELDLSRKQGFALPLAAWFRGAWGSLVEDVLSQADPSVFDRRMIAKLLRGQRRGFSHTARLFSLTMFELWRRHYRVELG